MSANTSPIYTLTPHVGWSTSDGDGGTNGPVKTGNAALDGTAGTTTVFTAGANGSYVQRVVAHPVGTNVATVLRVYINNGSSPSSSVNNVLFNELSIPASTASANSALQSSELPVNFALPAGYKLLISLGTTIAAGLVVSVPAGDY